MFALNGNPLPDISTGAPGETLQINALGTALEWAAITSAAGWGTKLSSGTAAAVAGGTYTNSGAFAAQKWLMIRITLTNLGIASAPVMRFNADAGAKYGFKWDVAGWTSGANEIQLGLVAPASSQQFIIFIGHLSTIYRVDGLLSGGSDQNTGGDVITRIKWAPNPATGITSVNMALTTNYDITYDIWGE